MMVSALSADNIFTENMLGQKKEESDEEEEEEQQIVPLGVTTTRNGSGGPPAAPTLQDGAPGSSGDGSTQAGPILKRTAAADDGPAMKRPAKAMTAQEKAEAKKLAKEEEKKAAELKKEEARQAAIAAIKQQQTTLLDALAKAGQKFQQERIKIDKAMDRLKMALQLNPKPTNEPMLDLQTKTLVEQQKDTRLSAGGYTHIICARISLLIKMLANETCSPSGSHQAAHCHPREHAAIEK